MMTIWKPTSSAWSGQRLADVPAADDEQLRRGDHGFHERFKQAPACGRSSGEDCGTNSLPTAEQTA